RLREQGRKGTESWKQMLIAQRWLPRDDEKVPQGLKPQMAVAMASSPVLTQLVAMREELRQLWTRTNVSREQLVADLQAWCHRAEESGIAALHELSLRVRAARV
ncbi:MAG: DesA/ISL3 alpha bundle tail domain-containing protein, partial [Burkholderiaceae bacterium]